MRLSPLHLEHNRPIFTRHEKSPGSGVIGNTVEDLIFVLNARPAHQFNAVDDPDDLSGFQVYGRDHFVVPDVREYYSIDIFKLVEAFDRPALQGNGDLFSHGEVL